MANHWYVRNDGGSNIGTASTATATATTDPGTKRTGAWSGTVGDYFPNIDKALDGDDTVAPVAGDFVYVGNDHAYTIAATIQYNPTAFNTSPVICLSVDVANQDQYLKGAKETSTGTGDLVLNLASGKMATYGIDFACDDDVLLAAGAQWLMHDCTLTLKPFGKILSKVDGGCWEFWGVALQWDGGTLSYTMDIANGGLITFDDCTFEAITSGTLDAMYQGTADNGGANVRVRNCDLSNFTDLIIFGTRSMFSDDQMDFRYENCKVSSLANPFMSATLQTHTSRFFFTNCSDVAAEAEHQFYLNVIGGEVRDSVGAGSDIYRAESTAFESGDKVSFKVSTSAECSLGAPISFDMPTRFADLTVGGTDAITVYIASGTALTKADTWVEVSYPDATNKQLWKTTSSRLADIIGTTALDTDAGSDWENAGVDLTTENEYKITVAAVTGAACVPRITVFCAVPSITLYVDTTVDLS